MSKKYDLVVKTGEYTDKTGEQKANWLNIGAVMDGEKGQYILLNRTFNPAGLPNPENRNNILISMFSKKEENQDKTQQENQPSPKSSDNPMADDSDIPF